MTVNANASVVAPHEVFCTHPQVCHLATSLLPPLSKNNPKITLAYKPHGDLHESMPTPSEMKKLATGNYIIIGPSELHPWSKKLLEMRKNLKGSTLNLELNRDNYPLYKNQSKHALSHFWLFPSIVLDLQKKLGEDFAGRFGLHLSEEKPNSTLFFETAEEEIKKETSRLKGYLFITSHEAIGPLFNNSEIKTIALKAHEHGELSPRLIKELENNLKNRDPQKTVWFLEKNISLSPQLLLKINPKNQKIEINIEGKLEDSLEQPLKDLINALKSLQ